MTATMISPAGSTRPSTDVSQGPRSGLRQNAGRNGPGDPCSRHPASHVAPVLGTRLGSLSGIEPPAADVGCWCPYR